jgi:fucose permease
MESSFNEIEMVAKQASPSLYSFRYRLFKTTLLILAWISFGMNFELIGSTLEDLKLFLAVDYQAVSSNLVARNVGYLLFVFLSGYLLDKYANYSDLLMAVSSICFAFRKPRISLFALCPNLSSYSFFFFGLFQLAC